MRECSYCGAQNEDQASICAGCGTKLREAAPPAEADPQLKDPTLSLVVVGTFSNVVDAGLLKSRLEAAGIEACIPEEYTPHIFWNLIPSPLESVTVRVAAKDYKAAKALADEGGEQEQTTDPLGTSPTKTETLSESKAPEPEKEPETEPTDGKRCVACGALMPAEAVYCPKCDWTQPPTA